MLLILADFLHQGTLRPKPFPMEPPGPRRLPPSRLHTMARLVLLELVGCPTSPSSSRGRFTLGLVEHLLAGGMGHGARAHVSQVLYFVKMFKLEGVASIERLTVFEAILAAYAHEAVDEGSCRSDWWSLKWYERLRKYVGAAPGANLERPWVPDVSQLLADEEGLMAEMRLEEEQACRSFFSVDCGVV